MMIVGACIFLVAAATAGGAIIGFIAAYCLMGIIAGLTGLVVGNDMTKMWNSHV